MFKSKSSAYIIINIAMIIWAVSFIWSKSALEVYSPLFVLPSRLLIASTLLFIFGKISGRLQAIHRSDYKWLVLLAFFEPFLYFIGENYGLQRVSPTIAAVIIATIPLFLPFVASIFFKERINRHQLIGIGISFVGVGMVLINNDMNLNADLLGIALLLLAVFAALGYTAVLKKVTQKYNPLTIVAWQSLIACIAFTPLFLSIAWEQTMAAGIVWDSLRSIILLGVFGSSVAFIAYTQSIRVLGITKAGVFANIIPVFTALFSFFMLHEALLLVNYLGIAMVIGGLFLSQTIRRKNN